MNIIERKGFYYLRHSYRKKGKVITKEKFMGKQLPPNIEEIKTLFLRSCWQEVLFQKLKRIKQSFQKEWRRLPESMKKKTLVDASIDVTYNSNAIEGSTVTLEETEEIIRHKIAPHKPMDDVQETISHSRVFLDAVKAKALNLKVILDWHKELFMQTKPDVAGNIREYLVRVGKYVAPDWQDLPKMLKDYFRWLEQNEKMNPVELAARAHYKFEKIHPFGDGNGRIGRLVVAQILCKHGYPLLVIEYSGRKTYYKALQKDENGFVQYFIRRYVSYNKRYL